MIAIAISCVNKINVLLRRDSYLRCSNVESHETRTSQAVPARRARSFNHAMKIASSCPEGTLNQLWTHAGSTFGLTAVETAK